MHFLPTTDQLELQHGVRDLLADRFPIDRLSQGFDATVWRALDETGVFGLRSDLGLGLAEAVLVFEELGRALVPGPLLGSHLAAGLVDGAADGSTVVGLVERPTDVVLVERTATVVPLLDGRPDLARVYADGTAVVYLRRTPANAEAIADLTAVAARRPVDARPTYFP